MRKIDRVDEFVSLYVLNSRRVYAFIRSLVPCHQDAEDIFQDVGKTLWEKFDAYQSGTNFLVWAFSISHFKVLQHRRVHSRLPASLSDAVFELIAEDLQGFSAESDARYEALSECLQKLPQRDRDIVDARYRHGQTTKSVAEELGRSADSIYRALRRIHKALLSCIRRSIATERWA